MDRKSNSEVTKKMHFARLHEKIRNKYNAMKMKLDKSKSVGSLASLNDDFEYKYDRYSSTSDVRITDEEFSEIESERSSLAQSLIIEDMHVHKCDATLQEINYDEASVCESDMVIPDILINDVDKENQLFFNDNFRTSLESLNEVPEDNISIEEELQVPPTPPPRISIRDKIGSRITAAKEKRNANKDKKKESKEKVEKLLLSNTTKQDTIKKKQKIATVTIALIEATGCENEQALEEKNRIFFCRIKLGSEKRKSKSVRGTAKVVSFQELFNLNLFDDHSLLEISLWNGTFLGRNFLDLAEMKKEKTHRLKLQLTDGPGNSQIFILLTISGTTTENNFVDLDDCQEVQKKLDSITRKFAWYHLRDDFKDIGWLSIIVYGAKGLSASDCYCILQLVNDRLQTHTEYKTNEPNWMKIFTFAVTDVTSILEITVCDERRSEDIGKISIPLLNIKNGNKKWYALKDNTQRDRAKGHNPRILLEMRFTWNLVKASVRVINTKEVKYLETEVKFDRQLFSKNWSRAKAVFTWTLDAFKVMKTCFEWESRKWNAIALSIWLLFCWTFKVWMLPLLLLMPFVWYRRQEYFLFNWKKYFQNNFVIEEFEEKEEKTSLRQKINSLQEMVQTVQNTVGKFASRGESIKNLYNFSVPFISGLTIFIVVSISCIMYFIPANYIFMCWGIHKFTRKILRPNRIPNSEILDLLSRVPDDDTLLNCEELPLLDLSEEEVKTKSKSKDHGMDTP